MGLFYDEVDMLDVETKAVAGTLAFAGMVKTLPKELADEERVKALAPLVKEIKQKHSKILLYVNKIENITHYAQFRLQRHKLQKRIRLVLRTDKGEFNSCWLSKREDAQQSILDFLESALFQIEEAGSGS